MQKVTAITLSRTATAGAGLLGPTRALRCYGGDEEDEEMMRLQAEMMRKSGGNSSSSSHHQQQQQQRRSNDFDDSFVPNAAEEEQYQRRREEQQQMEAEEASKMPLAQTATNRYFDNGTGGGGSGGSSGNYLSALERRRSRNNSKLMNNKGTVTTINPDGSVSETTAEHLGDVIAASTTSLGDGKTVADAMRVIEDCWIGPRMFDAEDEALIAEERGRHQNNNNNNNEDTFSEGDGVSGRSPLSSLSPSTSAALDHRFSDLKPADKNLLKTFIAVRPSKSIKDITKLLDNCKSPEDVGHVYKTEICNLPLWSDVLNGHGTRVVIMGKLTEVVAKTFCVEQWLEITAHARRYGFTLSRLHVNEVLTAIRINASAMFQQRGRDPQIVLKTLDHLQLLIHFSKEDHIRWEGVFMARLCLICTVIVSFMDRQNYYRASFPSDFHRREGIVGDWVITHARAIDYDETIRVVNRFLRDHGLDDHRQHLKIRPAFTTTYRLLDYYFASDNLSQSIATIEDAIRQGVNIAESTIAKLMQLTVSFNHPRAIDLFRKYRLRMPEAVIATPDISRLMTYYCRSGGGLPCPCCGEPYNHRNVQLSVWDSTPMYQRRCPLLKMAREQRGELEELARNRLSKSRVISGGGAHSLLAAADGTATSASSSSSALLSEEEISSIDKSIQEQLDAAEKDIDGEAIERLILQLQRNQREKEIVTTQQQNNNDNTAAAANNNNQKKNGGFAVGENKMSSTNADTISPADSYVDLPQCRDWSHIAFSLFEYSSENGLLWSIIEWRLFLQCCTFLKEPHEIMAAAERDVRRARAMRKKALAVDPEAKWAAVDPPIVGGAVAASSSGVLDATVAARTTANPTTAEEEVSAYLKSYAKLTIKVPRDFAAKHGLLPEQQQNNNNDSLTKDSSSNSAAPSALDANLNSLFGGGGEEGASLWSSSPGSSSSGGGDDTIAVPWLKMSKAAKFDFANNYIFKKNINFVTQIDDFVQRMYMRFLRCNNPQEVNYRVNIWFEEGVGSGRGSQGGEIAPIVSEEVMIAAFGINNESVREMRRVGGGRKPVDPFSAIADRFGNAMGMELAGDDGSSSSSIYDSSLLVAQMREEASSFAASRVHSQDLFVTAFAKRKARFELFKSGFLVKVHKKDVPRAMLDNFYQRQREQNQSQFAKQNNNSQSQQQRNIVNGIDQDELLANVLLPPIDISKFSDDVDPAEKDYFYVINPRAYGCLGEDTIGVASDFRFTAARSLMVPAATTDFAHLSPAIINSSSAADASSDAIAAAKDEAEANSNMLRRFVYLMRKKPRSFNARATFKDSGSDISAGFNKKNWFMVAKN